MAPYPPRQCGIGVYARDQVERLRSAGHHVMVLSPPDGEGDVRVPFHGGRPFSEAARRWKRFHRVIVHFQPAVYYRPGAPVSRTMTSAALLWLALRCPRLEIVVHEADRPALWRPDYLLLRLAFQRASRLSFHTEAERASLERDYGIRARGGIVPHRVQPVQPASRAEARKRLGIDDGGPVFLCAGFIQHSKGFDRAVRAFAGASSGRLYVVGSVREPTAANTAYLESLRELCRAVPRATLLERFVPDDEFDLWVAAADWVLLPYRRSWSSGVLARAHALGTPAIVSGVGGLPQQADERDVVFDGDDELARRVRFAADATPGQESAQRRGGSKAVPVRGRDRGISDWDPELEPPQTGKGRGMLLAFILVSVLLAALAQITLKHGMNQVTLRGDVPLELGQPMEAARRIALNAFVWIGLGTFALSAAIWLIVLSRASLSFAYPFASLTYVLILLFDRFILRAGVPGLRWGGVTLIVVGLLLVSRTHSA